MDKAFVQDICAATRPVEFDPAILNQARAPTTFAWAAGALLVVQHLLTVSSPGRARRAEQLCASLRDISPPAQVIAEHLYQQGHFSVGDIYVREAAVADGDALKEPYTAMHTVLKEVQLPHGCMRLLPDASGVASPLELRHIP